MSVYLKAIILNHMRIVRSPSDSDIAHVFARRRARATRLLSRIVSVALCHYIQLGDNTNIHCLLFSYSTTTKYFYVRLD
jgi:hypothetical protein